MSALDDLIKEIPDTDLQQRIKIEVDKLKATKKFGLVFEEQKPEVTPLYDLLIKINSLVAEKLGRMNQIYRVQKIEGEDVTCTKYIPTEEVFKFQLSDLVRVALFGEPIYPYLQKLDSICNAPDSDLWHTLIEADNYHALQLLQYVCKDRKVDCIYIDPPYNTGAKDWKYNDNYVDGSDLFRHSKWLSMMQKRLKLAKEILSDSGAIFISIDDNEQAYLKILCDEIFGRDNFVANIAVINNFKGRSDDKYIATAHESLLIYRKKNFITNGVPIPEEYLKEYRLEDDGGKYRLQGLRKRGANSKRTDRPNMFYPFYYDEEKNILSVDEIPNAIKILPYLSDKSEGRWRWGKDTAREKISELTVQKVKGREEFDIFQKDYLPMDGTRRVKPKSFWIGTEFSAEAGTLQLKNILGKGIFSTPKPLGLIKYILEQATDKNSLIVDFFAGSGTTLHAVNLLNAEDGGKRRCILVTNNEVAESEERRLKSAGYQPNDEEWQKLGVARYVTWKRTVCSIRGENINGEPLQGNYLGSEIPMSDGFKSNAIFFKLGFLNKNAVALGRQFKEILPVIWLKAGSYGVCPNLDGEEHLPSMLVLPENRFAVLLDEKSFMEFEEEVLNLLEIETVFIVTDSLDAYTKMIQNLRDRKTYQLYRDYLENFKINV